MDSAPDGDPMKPRLATTSRLLRASNSHSPRDRLVARVSMSSSRWRWGGQHPELPERVLAAGSRGWKRSFALGPGFRRGDVGISGLGRGSGFQPPTSRLDSAPTNAYSRCYSASCEVGQGSW